MKFRQAARVGIGLAMISGAIYWFILPAYQVARGLGDPALQTDAIPTFALELHQSLSERFAPWARARIAGGEAAHAPLHNVPETEWPLFSAVFYLNATESLADAGHEVAYARRSVDAARDLVMDPIHHTWVRRHFGDDYLHDRNVFFRALLISGLTSYIRLTGDQGDVPFLRDQVNTLAADLDASPHGVLEDYPGETYPIDVMAAVAFIAHADPVVGTDHSAFVRRARRAFVAPYDDELGLIRFRVDLPANGDAPRPLQPGRGIGNSWVGIYAPALWPDDADRWHEVHTAHFWQDSGWAEGFREYRRHNPEGEWTFEIDAGPVIGGFGTAASAFGIAAARRHGRFDQARTLTEQMIAVSWPRWDGSLRLPSWVSAPCAPLLGEAALAYFLTLAPATDEGTVYGGRTTPLVYAMMLFYGGGGLLLLFLGWRRLRPIRRALRARWNHLRSLPANRDGKIATDAA